MDFQNRPGAKPGGSGPMSYEDANAQRRERLKKMAMETADLSKDPYFLKNHLGSYECRLCLTIHPNQGSYLFHTQGKKHQTNLARRQAREKKQPVAAPKPKMKNTSRRMLKIGKPGFRVIKQKDPENGQKSLYFEIYFTEITKNFIPKHRIMSAFEQKLETPDPKFQFLLFAGDPYETIAFKIPNIELDRSDGKFFCNWNADKKIYTLQIHFKIKDKAGEKRR